MLAYIVGGWVWQDAYVIKKSMKKIFSEKEHCENQKKKNRSNFKPPKLVQKLHDIEIKNNIYNFFAF